LQAELDACRKPVGSREIGAKPTATNADRPVSTDTLNSGIELTVPIG